MNKQQKQHLLVVVYDSVTNSVFESQVFEPLVRMITDGTVKKITLVTFEVDMAVKNRLKQFDHHAIMFVVLKRGPLLGVWSLRLAATQLLYTVNFAGVDAVRARGPLAGFIAKQVLAWGRSLFRKAVPALTLQARGLCAEEYRFTAEQQALSWWKKIVTGWRNRLYHTIEKKVYSQTHGVVVEVVSQALGDYLHTHYATPVSAIELAQHDLVDVLDPQAVAQHRVHMRALLKIPLDAYVFCYSGSCKPWQCAKETIQFFMHELALNEQAFLLILSQDLAAFQELLAASRVPPEKVCLLAVQPGQLLTYLCAADAGMLLRKPDVVNWVSRPTKLLEYQAVGLRVVHNGTIGMLVE